MGGLTGQSLAQGLLPPPRLAPTPTLSLTTILGLAILTTHENDNPVSKPVPLTSQSGLFLRRPHPHMLTRVAVDPWCRASSSSSRLPLFSSPRPGLPQLPGPRLPERQGDATCRTPCPLPTHRQRRDRAALPPPSAKDSAHPSRRPSLPPFLPPSVPRPREPGNEDEAGGAAADDRALPCPL